MESKSPKASVKMDKNRVPAPYKPQSEALSFAEAMKLIVAGGTVTREAWPKREHVFIRDHVISIDNGTISHLVLSAEDLVAADWVVV